MEADGLGAGGAGIVDAAVDQSAAEAVAALSITVIPHCW